jgi:hypothetical protein
VTIGAGSNHGNRNDEVCVYDAAVGLPTRRTSESTMASIDTRARVGSWRRCAMNFEQAVRYALGAEKTST